MNDTIPRIDFTSRALPPRKSPILATADWIGQQDRELDFSEAIGFVILRRYDTPTSYGIHRIVSPPTWWSKYTGARAEGLHSNWAQLVSPHGATMFQELLIERGFAPTAWQDLPLDDKHGIFNSNILPLEWKTPSVMCNDFLADRVWFFRKGAGDAAAE